MLDIDNHIFLGMQTDFSESKQPAQFYRDAKNIRITASGDSTLMSIVNEDNDTVFHLDAQGLKYPIYTFRTLGSCSLSNYIIVFGKSKTADNSSWIDRILRIDLETMSIIDMFYNPQNQDLNFYLDKPIESIGVYENEIVSKVYWVDGVNQPRLMNIYHDTYTWNKSFDFNPELKLSENVTVKRNSDNAGVFPSGVIQYVFTYFNDYAQETSPFYITPLHYISFNDRGAAPDEHVPVSFEISINNIDHHFENICVYSVLRTSLNSTPLCKKVTTLHIEEAVNSMSFTDTYRIGESISPEEVLMLYKPEFSAGTIEIKNNTMFFGNITILKRNLSSIEGLKSKVRNINALSTEVKTIKLNEITNTNYYEYGLAYNSNAAGFKNHEYYRLGIQAQYKNGEWSEPLYIGDYQVNSPDNAYPSNRGVNLNKLVVRYQLSTEIKDTMLSLGYKKVRPLFVPASNADRTILCQGVANPTMYTDKDRAENLVFAQSSWFFRPKLYSLQQDSQIDSVNTLLTSEWYSETVNSPFSGTTGSSLPYANHLPNWNPKAIKLIEVQGDFSDENKFKIDWSTCTVNSPDIAESDNNDISFINTECHIVGYTDIAWTRSNLNIETSSANLSSLGSGADNAVKEQYNSRGIIAGLYYEDAIADDYEGFVQAYGGMSSVPKWMVYPWQAGGSLNNDIARTARSSVLQKKILASMRTGLTNWLSTPVYIPINTDNNIKVFDSDELSLVKLEDGNYLGNIDTLLRPTNPDGKYFGFYDWSLKGYTLPSLPEATKVAYKTWSFKSDQPYGEGIYMFVNGMWNRGDSNIGDTNQNLCVNKENVRMKYKSDPHIVFKTRTSDIGSFVSSNIETCTLPIVELSNEWKPESAFGGNTEEALRNNYWIPAGEAVDITSGTVLFEYGDTWFNRYDCIKTYPYSTEDVNQIIEIGSFVLESHINTDGRYDKHRGILNAATFRKENYNKINKVYSQLDNFFSYKILTDDSYKTQHYPNMIAWSLQHAPGKVTDTYSSISLTSSYYINSKDPEIHALKLWKETLLCFMRFNVFQILYDERVQINPSDGVPIEIANSSKVGGVRELYSETGCINKFAITTTPMGLYFIDSINSHLFRFSGQFEDISEKNNSTLLTANIKPDLSTYYDYNSRLFYNNQRLDVCIYNQNGGYISFNEKMGQFISRVDSELLIDMYSYQNHVIGIPVVISHDIPTKSFNPLYLHEGGKHNDFFIEFVSNKELVKDKIFTNIEFRGDVIEHGAVMHELPPFTSIRCVNEHQDSGERNIVLLKDRPSIIKKKFRIWRIDVPRKARSRDRIRNTWTTIKLSYNGTSDRSVIIHDINVYIYL